MEEIQELKDILNKFADSLGVMDKENLIELDNKFHDKIIEGSKNEKLIQIVQGLHEQVQRYRIIYFNEYNQHEDLLKYHKAIADAIEARDGEKAQKYAQTHVEKVEESILSRRKKEKSE